MCPTAYLNWLKTEKSNKAITGIRKRRVTFGNLTFKSNVTEVVKSVELMENGVSSTLVVVGPPPRIPWGSHPFNF